MDAHANPVSGPESSAVPEKIIRQAAKYHREHLALHDNTVAAMASTLFVFDLVPNPDVRTGSADPGFEIHESPNVAKARELLADPDGYFDRAFSEAGAAMAARRRSAGKPVQFGHTYLATEAGDGPGNCEPGTGRPVQAPTVSEPAGARMVRPPRHVCAKPPVPGHGAIWQCDCGRRFVAAPSLVDWLDGGTAWRPALWPARWSRRSAR